MLRLIDNRITYELFKRDFVVHKRLSVSKHHEQIRTLEDVVEMDKAGMIISPEIELHENVAVLDFNDEYANIITAYNISYENLPSENRKNNSIVHDQTASLFPHVSAAIRLNISGVTADRGDSIQYIDRKSVV